MIENSRFCSTTTIDKYVDAAIGLTTVETINRSCMMRKLLLAVTFLCSTFLVMPSYAADFKEGVHYTTLKNRQAVETADKIEVLELFWYGCPHCYNLEPHLKKWLSNIPSNAEYVALPAVFRKNWEPHARAYYTFDALGLVEKLHEPFFDAIHKERKTFTNASDLAKWADSMGVKKADIFEAYDSFAVNTKVQQGIAALSGYQATGVPTMIVDGKYSTSVSMAGGHSRMFEVIEYLIKKSESER